MVIVSAKATATPGKRDAFIKAAQESIAATRKEEGCICYELYASTEHPDKLMYYEQWTSREALDNHLKSAHMIKFGQDKIDNALQVGDVDVAVFTTAG
ncbi:MAG: antibiotic biosynthesis monooxygenase [Planctomycetaceae bacterium]|nr:antibiotic biosynthesis monooxygenase [Planctomycetaceae bacterium]